MSQLLVIPPAEDAPAGVGYDRVLGGPRASAARGLLGALMGLSLYFLVVPLVSQLVIALGWLTSGRPGTFADYYKGALGFETPWGMLGGHLALALLIPLSMVVVRAIHQVRPRWLVSVQPGARWRYALICFVVAALVLNGLVLATQRMGQAQPQAQAGLWVWLVLVVLTSPFQAAAEEFFFRGLLLQSFGSMTTRRWVPVLASSLVFALMHGAQNLPLFLDRFGFGLIAGALVLATGGLEAGIACHVANNLFAFGWALFYGGVANLRKTQAVGWSQLVVDLGGFGLFALCAWWIGRRMNLATRTPSVSL